ncbi:MAG: hypothetical protein KA165_12560 [Saprospiraceae bacterium]|nr:hypothetical protein [Saprospiraceae bacterium]
MKSLNQIPACILWATILLSTLTQCSKDATHGPRVDVTVDGHQFSKEITVKAAVEEKTLYLQAVGEENFESVIIQILGFHGAGIYSLEKPGVATQDNIMIYSPSPSSGKNFWNWANATGPGYLEVEYFDPNGSITVNFSCRLHELLEEDSVEVTGRFIDFPVEKKLPDSVSPDYASATVSGIDYIGYVSTELTNDFLVIKSVSGSNQGINLGFSKDFSPGIYDMTSFPGAVGMTYLVNNEVYYAQGGLLTITEHDKSSRRIRGKFNFTTQEGDIISNGEFSAGY